MKCRLMMVFSVMIGVVLVSTPPVVRSAELKPGGHGRITGQYIVVLNDNVNAPDDVAKGHGLAATHKYRHALRGFAATISDQKLAKLLKLDVQVFSSLTGFTPD